MLFFKVLVAVLFRKDITLPNKTHVGRTGRYIYLYDGGKFVDLDWEKASCLGRVLNTLAVYKAAKEVVK
nr:MAG TPA: Thioredoxin-like SNTX domain [Caudoviricetes sp.]